MLSAFDTASEKKRFFAILCVEHQHFSPSFLLTIIIKIDARILLQNLTNYLQLLFQIASRSKASTKSRFFNRSFHILSCDRNMTSTPSCNASASIALDNSNNSENSRCRLDRKLKGPFEELSWSRCNWQQSFLVAVIIVLLNLTSIECLQARQEGKCVENENLSPPYLII
jgi:hypothetical protein